MRQVIGGIVVALLMIAAAVALAAPGSAKGRADAIVVRGPSLVVPVEIRDLDVLERFNPWIGRFLGRPVTDRPIPRGREPYEVEFHLDRGGLEPSVIYGFDYHPGVGDSSGYIKLPDPRDERNMINRRTIIRDTDGGWHQATAAWDRVMADHLDTAAAEGDLGRRR